MEILSIYKIKYLVSQKKISDLKQVLDYSEKNCASGKYLGKYTQSNSPSWVGRSRAGGLTLKAYNS